MGYNSVVCVKQVPDTRNIAGEAMTAEGTINRGALPAILNPDDSHALEAALAIRDAHGGTVTVVTMGPPMASDVLRQALYRGADKAVLITDDRAAGSDALATSYVLSCAVRRLDPDLVFCGRRAVDGENAQVGPQLAEKMGITLITYVDQPVEIEDRTVTVRRRLDNGWEYVSTELPVLLTITNTANTPRPPSIKRVMKLKKARSRPEVEEGVARQAKRAKKSALTSESDERCDELETRGLLIHTWNLDDIGADPIRCGLQGSATKVHRVQSIVLSSGTQERFENSDRGVANLIAALIKDRTIG